MQILKTSNFKGLYEIISSMHNNGACDLIDLVGSSLIAFLLGITDINPMPAHYYCTECHFVDFDVVKQDGFDLQDRKCPVCGEQLKSDGHDIPVEFFMGYNGSINLI